MGNVKLFRIRALRDIPKFGVKTGDLGGYVQSENNLSHYGECWVYGEACVFGSALVYGEAQVYGSALVFDSARVFGSAQVYGEACVFGSAQVYGKAWVYGSARVFGSAQVYGNEKLERITDIVSISIPSRFNITVTYKNVYVGCKVFKRTEYIKNMSSIEALAKEHGMTDSEIKAYRHLIKGVMISTRRVTQ